MSMSVVMHLWLLIRLSEAGSAQFVCVCEAARLAIVEEHMCIYPLFHQFPGLLISANTLNGIYSFTVQQNQQGKFYISLIPMFYIVIDRKLQLYYINNHKSFMHKGMNKKKKFWCISYFMVSIYLSMTDLSKNMLHSYFYTVLRVQPSVVGLTNYWTLYSAFFWSPFKLI